MRNNRLTHLFFHLGGNKPAEARISGYNFRAWEKYDVDKAIDNIDEEDRVKQKLGMNTLLKCLLGFFFLLLRS